MEVIMTKKKEVSNNLEKNNKSISNPNTDKDDVRLYPVVDLMNYLKKIVELSESTAINITDTLNNVIDINIPVSEYNYACYDDYPKFFQDLLKSLATVEKSLISINNNLSKVRFEY
jgi:hypothetical protein